MRPSEKSAKYCHSFFSLHEDFLFGEKLLPYLNCVIKHKIGLCLLFFLSEKEGMKNGVDHVLLGFYGFLLCPEMYTFHMKLKDFCVKKYGRNF